MMLFRKCLTRKIETHFCSFLCTSFALSGPSQIHIHRSLSSFISASNFPSSTRKRPFLEPPMPINSTSPSSSLPDFQRLYENAAKIVVLTGAGVSAESGVPTFRGAGGLWRRWNAQDLATPEAFNRDPSLVWEFYHYRRELMASTSPNAAHDAIARAEREAKAKGKSFAVVTQNIDGLHARAGSEEIVELHGNLFKTRCTKCRSVAVNNASPICSSLSGLGSPDPSTKGANIPVERLPRCSELSCGGLLRPHVVWFGESLESRVMDEAERLLGECDICLVVGTSSVVYPAAMFAPSVAARGVPVAEFNIEETPVTHSFGFCFVGPAGETLPKAI